MKTTRRRHAPEFKAHVALEALKGIKTMKQIAKDFDLHPVQVSDWKKIMTEGVAKIFGPGPATPEAKDFRHQHEELQTKIGQLSAELDFLRKKSEQLGL